MALPKPQPPKPEPKKPMSRWVQGLLIFTLLDLALGLAVLVYFQGKFF